jgi:hypothetical protein
MATTDRASHLQIEVARWLVVDDDARAVVERIIATTGGSLPGGRRQVQPCSTVSRPSLGT